MAYFYRIIFNDGTKKNVVPENFINKKLSTFDNFSMSDDFTKFIEDMCNRFNLSKFDIDSIKIVNKTSKNKEIEYNLLESNPYFYDIFSNTEEKEIWEYNYKTEREVVSVESDSYQEMRDYVLDQLKRNSKVFLNEVYKYPNKFKEILEKYAKSYESNDLNEEDYHQLYELETIIRHHLTIYKIYRSVAGKRYNYEKYNGYFGNKKNNVESQSLNNNHVTSDRLIEEYYDSINTVSHRTKEYNEKYDEFIEPDEYGQMNGYTGGKVL